MEIKENGLIGSRMSEINRGIAAILGVYDAIAEFENDLETIDREDVLYEKFRELDRTIENTHHFRALFVNAKEVNESADHYNEFIDICYDAFLNKQTELLLAHNAKVVINAENVGRGNKLYHVAIYAQRDGIDESPYKAVDVGTFANLVDAVYCAKSFDTD